MICKNCSAEFEDGLGACPECGAEFEGEENAVSPCEEENTEAASEAESSESTCAEDEEAQAVEHKKEDESEEAELLKQSEAEAQKSEPAGKEETASSSMMSGERVKRIPPLRRVTKTRAELMKERKNQKTASALIIVVMCLVAALSVGVTVLNLTTDVFDDDGTGEKVVAGIGFTAQEKKELEELLAKSFSVSRNGYDRADAAVEEFLANIIPGDEGNVYAVLNGVNEPIQSEADPAGRFSDENGAYAYYKLDKSRVDMVLELFGLESLRGENTENYYYCDGFYYFAALESKATPAVNAEIVKSRRVIDGSYYAEGYFYAEKNGETVKTDNYHFVVEMTRNADTGKNAYLIRKVSKEPIFGSDGKLVDGTKVFEVAREVIEGYTDDGKLFCVYTLEFPVAEGNDEGCKNLNEFFKNAVSVYELKAKSAQQAYAEFKSNGGDESKLPVVENVIASIVCEDENKLTFKSEISSYSPVINSDGFYKKSVEAYTFDKKTGEFVSKDDAVGKNYMLIGEVLYRIYSGYEYESLLPKENAEEDGTSYDDVPSDRSGIGAKIYESAWSYTEDGVTFWYLNEMGYITEVTIPSEIVKKLK